MSENHQTEEPPDLALERLSLERERLSFERERLDEKERRLADLEAALTPRDERAIPLSPAVLWLAAAACLVLGALAGAALGWDAGRSKAPPPRKVLVSRQFLSLLARSGGLPLREGADGAGAADSDFRGWIPAARTFFPENDILIR